MLILKFQQFFLISYFKWVRKYSTHTHTHTYHTTNHTHTHTYHTTNHTHHTHTHTYHTTNHTHHTHTHTPHHKPHTHTHTHHTHTHTYIYIYIFIYIYIYGKRRTLLCRPYVIIYTLNFTPTSMYLFWYSSAWNFYKTTHENPILKTSHIPDPFTKLISLALVFNFKTEEILNVPTLKFCPFRSICISPPGTCVHKT